MMNPIIHKKDGTVPLLWGSMILYFNKKVRPLYHPDQGKDLLMMALVFEIVRYGISYFKDSSGYSELISTGVIGVVFLGLLFLVIKLVQVNLKDIGLEKLSCWNRYEIFYFLLITPVWFFLFYYFNKAIFSVSLNENGWEILLVIFILYMCWGFYQEWIYRGLLQTELTRRYGATTAIILANVIFTFGPLHFDLIYQGKFIILGAIFLIGLFFGAIYNRSYNLWIIAILHGIGDWFLIGLP